jgi:hypothetical protein
MPFILTSAAIAIPGVAGTSAHVVEDLANSGSPTVPSATGGYSAAPGATGPSSAAVSSTAANASSNPIGQMQLCGSSNGGTSSAGGSTIGGQNSDG